MAAAAAAPLAGKPKQLSAALREVCQVEFDKCWHPDEERWIKDPESEAIIVQLVSETGCSQNRITKFMSTEAVPSAVVAGLEKWYESQAVQCKPSQQQKQGMATLLKLDVKRIRAWCSSQKKTGIAVNGPIINSIYTKAGDMAAKLGRAPTVNEITPILTYQERAVKGDVLARLVYNGANLALTMGHVGAACRDPSRDTPAIMRHA